MKKRCTNSVCRKVFSSVGGACPHCGKIYRRMGNTVLVNVVLTGHEMGSARVRAVKALRDQLHRSLRESHTMVMRLSEHPLTVAAVTRAEAPETVRFWEERGFRVVVVPRASNRRP